MNTLGKHPIDNDNDISHQRKGVKNRTNSDSGNASISARSPVATSAQQREQIFIQDSNNPTRDYHANKRPLSALESLPADLLEKIFVFSLNLSLPRSSPYLAAAVSNERVYRLLILLAFWDNDKRHDDFNFYSTERGNAIGGDPARYENLGTYPWREIRTFNIPWLLRPLGHDYVPLTSRERGALQSDILQTKWCTNDRIRRQFPDLARLIIARWCVNTGYMIEEGKQGRQLEELLHSEETKPFYFLTTRKIIKRRKKEKKEWYPNCRVTVRMGKFVNFYFYESKPTNIHRQEHANLCFPFLSLKEIPPSLFSADINNKGFARGRFTDSHVAFLNTICHSGMYRMEGISTSNVTYSRDALQQGVHTALCTINPLALDILLKLDDFLLFGKYDMPSDHFRTAAQTYLDIIHKLNNNDHLKSDADRKKVKDDAFLCLCLLLSSDAESLPHDDPIITRFANVVGGAFGRWLLDFMVILPEHVGLVKGSDDLDYDCNVMFRARQINRFPDLGVWSMRHHLRFETRKELRSLVELPAKWMSECITPYGFRDFSYKRSYYY